MYKFSRSALLQQLLCRLDSVSTAELCIIGLTSAALLFSFMVCDDLLGLS